MSEGGDTNETTLGAGLFEQLAGISSGDPVFQGGDPDVEIEGVKVMTLERGVEFSVFVGPFGGVVSMRGMQFVE